jgi:sugar/nucleoside kinase (ribokinase family)
VTFKYDVVVAGHICLDITPTFAIASKGDIAEIFQPGKLLKVGNAVLGTGGAVSNTGIALSKLGLKVSYMSSVGQDEFGEIIIEKMAEYGNVKGFFRNEEVGSSYSVILAMPAIDRIILHNPGCNDYFTAENINWEIVSSARLFHLGYPPIMRSLYADDGVEMASILRKVRSLGVATSVDMALPDPNSEAGLINWEEWFKNVLPHVDLFMPSIEEMLLFTDRNRWQQLRGEKGDFVDFVPIVTYREIADNLLELGCRVVILKAGRRGMYMMTGQSDKIAQVRLFTQSDCDAWTDRELWGASYHVEDIQSATGAGDSAAAGVLSAILRGKSVEETLQFGNCLGYQNLMALDTVSGIGTYEDTESLLTDLTSAPVDFLDDRWSRTSSKGIWERRS